VEHGTIKGKILTEMTMRVHTPSLTAEMRPWCLQVVAGNPALVGREFALGDTAILGREEGVDLQLPEISVSRRHCHLYRKRGGYWVTDLGATNPTRVNGMQITSTPLLDGDLLAVGDLVLKLLGPTQPDNVVEFPTGQNPQDPVTGLANRWHFRTTIESAFHESNQGSDLTLLVLDLDHFKHVNDRFGMATGNRLLGAIGKLVRDQSRPKDVAGRIGGEEFAVLMPHTAKQDAMRAAERMRMSIAALQLIEDGEPIMLTATFGVASARSTDTTADLLYARADAALYEGKRLGRNRVVTFPDA